MGNKLTGHAKFEARVEALMGDRDALKRRIATMRGAASATGNSGLYVLCGRAIDGDEHALWECARELVAMGEGEPGPAIGAKSNRADAMAAAERKKDEAPKGLHVEVRSVRGEFVPSHIIATNNQEIAVKMLVADVASGPVIAHAYDGRTIAFLTRDEWDCGFDARSAAWTMGPNDGLFFRGGRAVATIRLIEPKIADHSWVDQAIDKALEPVRQQLANLAAAIETAASGGIELAEKLERLEQHVEALERANTARRNETEEIATNVLGLLDRVAKLETYIPKFETLDTLSEAFADVLPDLVRREEIASLRSNAAEAARQVAELTHKLDTHTKVGA